MALVTTLKDFMTNTIRVNKSRLGTSNADNILNQMDGVTFIGDMIQTGAQQNWLSQITPSYFDSTVITRVLFNWYDRKEYLKNFTSNTVYQGYPTNNITLDKNTSFNKKDDILIYMGSTYANGDFKLENEIFSFYYKRETDNTFTRTAGGLRYKKMHYLRDFWIGSPTPVYSPANFKLRPLFNGYFTGNTINEAFSGVINFIASDVNLYQGMDDSIESATNELNYYIVDDNDESTYHMFRVYNKAQLFNLFLLFDMDIYYKTVEDLQEGTNYYDFNDIGESEPTTDTEPNIQTNPGQAQNSVQNQQNGTGDWSSTEVTAPDTPYTGTGIGNCLYTINLKQMYKVRNELFRPDIISSFFIDNESLLGCTIWPFKYSGNGLYTVTEVIIGKYHVQLMGDSSITPYAYAVLPTYIPKIYVAQGVSILPKNGNFLDYAPYTKIKFYLPYIGIVDVDPCDIYDHTIDIYYLYEPTTGKGKGCIKSSSGVTYSWDCMLGTTVPFTISNMNQLMQNLALAGIKAAGVYATGGLGAVGEAYSATEVISSIAGSVRDFKISSTGSTGDSMGRLEPQEVYCITVGPYTRIPDDYAKNYGRPSLITVTLNKLRGFTTVPNPLFTTTATDTEKAEIVALLQGGVIING